MFFKTLDRLREKSVSQKKNMAFLAAGSLTLIIALFWAVSIPTRFANESGTLANEQGSSFPFSGLADKVKDQWAATRAALPVATSTPATSTIDTLATSTVSDGVEYSSAVLSSSTTATSTKNLQIATPILIGTTSATSGAVVE